MEFHMWIAKWFLCTQIRTISYYIVRIRSSIYCVRELSGQPTYAHDVIDDLPLLVFWRL